MIVVANLRDTDTSFTIPFPNGRWHELVFEYEIEATNGNISDTFPPSTAKLYVRDIN